VLLAMCVLVNCRLARTKLVVSKIDSGEGGFYNLTDIQLRDEHVFVRIEDGV